jgi:hypothetical protein
MCWVSLADLAEGIYVVVAWAGCLPVRIAKQILGASLVLPAAEGNPNFELASSGKSALSSCIFLGML